MNVSVYQAASSMSALARWQETIAENLAASKVPGYKASHITFKGELGGKLPIGDSTSPDSNSHYVLPTAAPSIRFQEGPLERTEVPTHVAIVGDAFFEVELDNGESAYTRDGEFSLDFEGNMITKQGFRVLGGSGAILLAETDGKIEISDSGEITVAGKTSGQQMKTVEIEDRSKLQPIGGGFYQLSDDSILVEESETPTLKSGHLEGSNVAPMQEMTRLIDVMRAYQSNQKIVQTHDERIGRTISELGTPAL